MIARRPVWLVLPGEDGPGRHRMEVKPDRFEDDPLYDPDEGLLKVILTEETELLASDSDPRWKGGDQPPLVSIVPRDVEHPHYTDTGCARRCTCGAGADNLPTAYRRTDAGWYLVVTLPGNAGEVWIHEDDVPVDNVPKPDWSFGRRPPESS